MTQRCEGYERKGGAFTLGPVTWTQCSNPAVVIVTFKQDDDGVPEGELPACMECWKKALEAPNVEVVSVRPIDNKET